MNKDEAIRAIKDGKKITHIFFEDHEYVEYIGNAEYRFEDGVIQDEDDFWELRDSENWDKNWSIFGANE